MTLKIGSGVRLTNPPRNPEDIPTYLVNLVRDLENILNTPLQEVPAGGSSGQVLTKGSVQDYDTEWTTVSGGGGGGSSVWGGITGTLSDQTDLQSALDGKQPLATVLTNITASYTTSQETKLLGIETGATADQTGTEIVSAIDTELGSSDWQSTAVQVIRVPITGPANLNTASPSTLTFGTATINTISGSTINASDIDLPSGLYKFTLTINLAGVSARSNVSFIFYKDAVEYSRKIGANYIRAASGHNEAGDTFVDVIEYSSTGAFSASSFRSAAAGTVPLDSSADSILIIERLSA